MSGLVLKLNSKWKSISEQSFSPLIKVVEMTYDIVLLIHVYPDPINVRHVNELDLGINNGRIEFGFILFKKN